MLPAIAVALALLACPSREEKLEQAREAVPAALERGDMQAARAAVSGIGAEVPDTPEQLIAVASLLFQAGEGPRALWLLEAGAERFPERDDVQLALAGAALRLSNPSLSLSVAQRIPESSPQHLDALVMRANAELGLGHLDAALALLKEAEQRYPDHPESRLVRIATLTSEHRNDEAAAAIAEALDAVGEGEKGVALRHTLVRLQAQVRLAQGDADAAIASLRELVAQDPSDLQAWQLLVQGLVVQDHADEAIALLEANLAGADPRPELHGLLAPLYAATGRRQEAEQALRHYAETSPSPAAIEPLVQYLAARGDSVGVETAVRDAVARFPEEPQLRVLHAEALLALDDLPGAEAAAEIYSGLPGASDANREYLRARLELARGESEAAAERLRTLAPQLDLASTQYWLARALEAQGDRVGAERRYEMATQRDPNWPAPTAALLQLAMRRGDWPAVGAHAESLIRQARDNPDGWRALASAAVELGKGDAAEKVSSQALTQFPDRLEFHVLHAQALRLLGRRDEALAELAQVQADPAADPATTAQAAIALGMLGQIDQGLAAARAAQAQHPDDASLHAALAQLLFAAGDAEAGSHETDRALALEPAEPRPLATRCTYRVANGRFEEALADCEAFVEARPADARGWFVLASAREGAGRPADAIAAYRKAASLDERDFRPLNNLAGLLASQGDLDGALAAGQEAYRLAGDDPYVADTLGDLYLRKGLVERAIALLEQAHHAAPELPDAQLHLAQAYAQAGRRDEARALLDGLDRSLPPGDALRAPLAEAQGALR